MTAARLRIPVVVAVAATLGAALAAAFGGGALAPLAGAVLAALAGGAATLWPVASGAMAERLVDDPARIAERRAAIDHEVDALEDAQELQRGVFEVSAELVGCVEEGDARNRFAAAMRRYWSCREVDLLLWERGAWRSLGGPGTGAAPALDRPVLLPGENAGDLVLDLSPGVAGQAALVLRGAAPQPSLRGRDDADQRYVAEVLRGQLALSLRRVMLYGELQALARVDPLTGTHRRWYGERRLDELIGAGEVVAVAMVDIDRFKTINDGHGHAAGDRVLAAVGRCLAGHLRTGDLACRWGGEEFLLILPDTSPGGAEMVAGRLRSAVAALADLPCGVTVSIGVASVHQDEPPTELIRRADRALYAAKHDGRNKVVLAEEHAGTVGGGVVRTTARHRKRPGPPGR
jgi:diguanylate cyclase (GGDEF)-like protein